MKKLIFLLIGIVPLILGYLVNYFMYISSAPLFIIYFAGWIIWFFAGMYSIKLFDKKIEPLLLLNAPAFFFLLLILYQEIGVGYYWPNLLGVIPQLYYTPFIYVGFSITQMLQRTFYACLASFICMLVVSFIGRFVGEYQRRKE
jgi:hypothetical protein